jgi:hypothetical protein
VRFDETEKSVRVLLVTAAADPQGERFVGYRNYPAPVLCDGFLDFESFAAQSVPEELRQPLALYARVDPLLLPIVGGKAIRTKPHVCLYRDSISRSRFRRHDTS